MVPTAADYDRIKSIRDFESLVSYLQDALDWPIAGNDFRDVAFDYDAEELGLDKEASVKVKSIKQLRPLTTNQPWGVFYLEFESKRLPVVVLRKILRGLATKRRGGPVAQPTWHLRDLLFISATGEEDRRGITFAHFRDNANGTPVLQTFSWDEREIHFFWLQSLNLERLRWPHDGDADPDRWREQWSSAFTTARGQVIATSKELSIQLAKCAKSIRAAVLDSYNFESKTGPLHKLYESFRTVLIHDLEADGFADMVAQTITYGLFSARATGEKVLGLTHLEAMIPNTNPFLKELFAEFTKLSGHGKGQIDFDELGIARLVDMLNSRDTDMEAILADFGRQTRGGQEDPVIHFYELFLKEYDRQQKVKRGVFYTPRPVVLFIVRSVHKVLQEEFGLKYGLADTTTWGEMAARNRDVQIPTGVPENSPFVQILDPATGTGTFLVETIDLIHETMVEKWREEGLDRHEIAAAWNKYVPEHLLPRLYGFELMMAPYAIAHLKIGLKLRETGYDFQGSTRLQVYLTNTLEEPKDFSGQLIPDFLSHEAEAANRVKRDAAIAVVVGNPPYSAGSTVRGGFIDGLLQDYAEGLGVEKERKKGVLQDEYVRFIRYCHWRLAKSSIAVLGLIANNSFLDGTVHRAMRRMLVRDFDHAIFLNLHGSGRAPVQTGLPDQNVFDILQGVCICVLARTLLHEARKPPVLHGELVGSRDTKYARLTDGCIEYSPLEVREPYYLLRPLERCLFSEYTCYPCVADVFVQRSSGIETEKDHFAVAFDKMSLIDRLQSFAAGDLSDREAARCFELKDTPNWQVAPARSSLRTQGIRPDLVICFLFHAFDLRYTYYSDSIITRPRRPIMQHMFRPNRALLSLRQVKGEEFGHTFVASAVSNKFALSSQSSNVCYHFPLYLYDDASSASFLAAVPRGNLFDTQEHLPLGENRVANISQDFCSDLSGRLGIGWQKASKGDLRRTAGPDDAFNYIYAALHSPGYRSRYADFLKIDFPRIPLTSDLDLFRSLCRLGEGLVGLHLMEKHGPVITAFPVSGDNIVEKVRYTEPGQGSPEGRVWINSSQYFEGVPPEVWEFHIGGYQVCEKWLKDRGPKKGKPGRKLCDEDILHYQRVVAALKETIRVMAEIDQAIEAHGGWPLPGSVPEGSSDS